MKAIRAKSAIGKLQSEVKHVISFIESVDRDDISKAELERLECDLLRYLKYSNILQNAHVKPLHEIVKKRREHSYGSIISQLIGWSMKGVHPEAVERVLQLIKK